MSIDGNEVLNVTPRTNMWEYGGLDKDGVQNPWAAGNKMAPFDQEVRLYNNLTHIFIHIFYNSIATMICQS